MSPKLSVPPKRDKRSNRCGPYPRESFPVAPVVQNLPASAGDIRDAGSILGSGRSPGEGHGNPLQYSCLENPMDRGASWATAHRVSKGQTRLSDLVGTHTPLEPGETELMKAAACTSHVDSNHLCLFPASFLKQEPCPVLIVQVSEGLVSLWT